MKCKYCSHGHFVCLDESPKGLICTRRKKHRGEHIACGDGDKHVIASWENEADIRRQKHWEQWRARKEAARS